LQVIREGKEKFESLNINIYVLEIFFIIFNIVSIFVKTLYLQYTIKLQAPPFSLTGDISKFIILSTIILVLAAALLAQRKSIISLFILNILTSFVLFSDALYGRYYGIPLTIPMLYQIGFVGDISQSIFSLIKIKDFVFIIDIPVLGFFIYFLRTNIHEKLKSSQIIRNIGIIAIMVLSLIIFTFYGKNVDTTRHAYERKNIAKDFGTLYFHAYDIYDFAKQKIARNTSLKEDEKEIIREVYAGKDKDTSKYFGTERDKNLIVIQVEAMQGFVADLLIEGEEVTPFLNGLKNNSFYFNNIYHQVAGGNTSDAEFMLNNSLYPAAVGAVNYLYPLNEYLTLADILNEEGYRSRVFHSYDSSFWNREAVYRNFDYEKFYSINDFNLDEKKGWALSDDSFFKQALDISRDKGKFFSFLITLSSHHPYDAFTDIDLKTGDFEDTQLGNYLKSMNYVDMAIKNLFDDLREKNLLEDTIIVIYGDHSGLYQDQRGLLEKLLELDGSNLDWNMIQKVPLWIFNGQDGEGRTIEKTGGQIDILPTVLDLMGLSHPYALGESLLNDKPGYVVKRDGTVIIEGYYYDNQEKVLYDIESKKAVEDSSVMSIISEKQKELVVSDLILKKDLLKNDKLSEIIK
jgi:lipoteichoic acid synthase